MADSRSTPRLLQTTPVFLVRWIVWAVLVLSSGCGEQAGPSLPATPTSLPLLVGLTCGTERWAVKTLSDPDVSAVDIARATPTTIAALNALAPHCSGLPERRTFPQEFQTFEVVGRITFVRLEDDRDYHIAVADPAASDQTIVTELADPQCQGAVSSPHTAMLTGARRTFDQLAGGRPSSLVGRVVRIRGVGFFDFNHSQTGRSRSCIELHPITDIQLVPGT